MQYFLLVLIWQFYNRISSSTTALSDINNNNEKCPLEQTVNLTGLVRYENGSVLYRNILIPPEKQDFYDNEGKLVGTQKSIEKHVRGCVCDQTSCTRLCCAENEYFRLETSKCEKFKSKKNISWDLSVLLNNHNNRLKRVNILKYFTIQIGLPACQNMTPVKELEWDLFKNGTLFSRAQNFFHGTLSYCFSPHFDNISETYFLEPFVCPTQIENEDNPTPFYTYAIICSSLFLIPTIVIHLVLRELRESLSGKLLICYLSSLTIAYLIIIFINLSQLYFNVWECSLLGFSCYFFFMSALFWLGTYCYDIWKNFTTSESITNGRKARNIFFIYSLFPLWGAGLFTGFAVFLQVSPHVNEFYKPGIGHDICWLSPLKWSTFAYYHCPNMLITILNFLTFAHLFGVVYKVNRDILKNAYVFLRLLAIMVVALLGLFDVLSFLLLPYVNLGFLYISNIATAAQGILIFVTHIMKPKVLNRLLCK